MAGAALRQQQGASTAQAQAGLSAGLHLHEGRVHGHGGARPGHRILRLIAAAGLLPLSKTCTCRSDTLINHQALDGVSQETL